jgi:hypothetical protein
MTDTLTKMSTEDVLIAMLTENTGRHMLDSGGAYGRNWERNGGMTVEAAMAVPEVHVETWERDGTTVVEYCTLDLFHFLRQRCDFDAVLDAQFREFAMSDEYREENWFTCLDAWLDSIGARFQGDPPMVVNTYNGEDNLSQVIQYAIFDHPETDDPIAAIMIHGGCDVRGGYTAPRMFAIGDAYALFDNADLEVYMREPGPVIMPGQDPLFTLPARPDRSVGITVRGGYGDRYAEPHDDKSLDAITFEFGTTPVTVEGDTYTVADGPAKGWTVYFGAPYAGN